MLSSAIIGIRHRLPHSPLYMVEQQRQFRLAVRRPHAAQVGEVFGIQRNDVIEPAEIVGGHLSRSQMRDIDAISRRHGRGAAIRRMADVPYARPGGIDIDIQPKTPPFPPERPPLDGGATKVAETSITNDLHQNHDTPYASHPP